MVHLDKLQDEMSSKGLAVVAVTTHDRSMVDKFLEETHAKHPIVIEKTDSMRAYGCHSFPSGFLIGTNGRILWKGHPGNLQDATLEETLSKAHILPDFPKALSSAQHALERDKFAEARKKTALALEHGKLEGADKEAGQKIVAWLDWYADSTLESAGKDASAGNVYAAYEAYKQVEDYYKGADASAKAKSLAKDLESDKEHRLEIKAGKRLARIKADLGGMTPKKAIKALKPLTGRKYAETKAGKEAADLVAEYEKAAG